MYPDPERLVTGTELWLQLAEAPDVQYDDPVQVIDSRGRVVSRRLTQEAGGGLESIATPDTTLDEVQQPPDSPITTTGVQAASGPELLLPDVPLIIEDLLMRAKQLADFGAQTAAIAEILDQVAALREGMG